jgi:tetratricopeptide (TPR) repeat protein
MTTLLSADGLGSPTRLVDVPPPLSRLPEPKAELDSAVTTDLSEPGYLLQARALVESSRRTPTALARLAHAELAAGNPQIALEVARSIVAEAGSSEPDTPALFTAAQMLAMSGHGDEAETVLETISAEPAVTPLFASLAVARGELDIALARLSNEQSAVVQAIRGWVQLQRKAYPAAIHDLRASAVECPDFRTYVNLGVAFASVGAFAKAIRATETAIGLAPWDLIPRFNLVAYRVATGQYGEADSELQRIRQDHPTDLRAAFLRAWLLARVDNLPAALHELSRARSSQAGWRAAPTERAELASTIAYLEYRLGKRNRKEACQVIHRELVKTGHRSLVIAGLLAGLMTSTRDAGKFAAVYEALERVNSREALLGLATHLAFLECRFDDALKLVNEWSTSDPLSEPALTYLTWLTAEVAHDFEKAAAIGAAALRKIPSSTGIANNVAYAYALDDKPDLARRYVRLTLPGPVRCATEGLISVVAGKVDEGLQAYENGAQMAEQRGDAALAALIRFRSARLSASIVGEPEPAPPQEYAEDARFIILVRTGFPCLPTPTLFSHLR